MGLVYDPNLEGAWGEDNDHWIFEKAGDNEYKLTIKSGDDEPAVFSAHLVQLKKYRFLDIMPTEVSGLSDFEQMLLVPVHTFWQIERDGDAFRLRNFNYEWLEDRFEKGRLCVPHEKYEDWFILTAEPKRPQRFVLRWVNNKEAFGDWEDMPREPSQETASK